MGRHLNMLGWKVSATVLAMACVAFAQPASPDRPRRERGGPGMRGGDRPTPPDDEEGPPGRGPHPGPFAGRPPLWTDLPEPQRRQIEKFIEDNFPRMSVELHRLETQNERRFVFRMSRIAGQMRRIMDTLKVDPQRGAQMIRERQIEMEVFQTVLQYREATEESAKQRLQSKIEELAGQMFDLRHERRVGEVRNLETRLELLKTRLDESQRMRTELIARHVEEILSRPAPPTGDEEGDAPPPPPDEGEEP